MGKGAVMAVKRFFGQIWWCGGFRLLFLWRLKEERKIVMVCGGDEDSEGESICDFAGKNGDDGGHDFLRLMGSLVVRRSCRWYGKRKTVEKGTRLVWQLMVFGFVEVGEG